MINHSKSINNTGWINQQQMNTKLMAKYTDYLEHIPRWEHALESSVMTINQQHTNRLYQPIVVVLIVTYWLSSCFVVSFGCPSHRSYQEYEVSPRSWRNTIFSTNMPMSIEQLSAVFLNDIAQLWLLLWELLL